MSWEEIIYTGASPQQLWCAFVKLCLPALGEHLPCCIYCIMSVLFWIKAGPCSSSRGWNRSQVAINSCNTSGLGSCLLKLRLCFRNMPSPPVFNGGGQYVSICYFFCMLSMLLCWRTSDLCLLFQGDDFSVARNASEGLLYVPGCLFLVRDQHGQGTWSCLCPTQQ